MRGRRSSLLFRLGTGIGPDLRYRRVSGDVSSRTFVATPANESDARFSPDGRWVAYAPDEAGGGLDVYVRAFPDGALAYRITESGGSQPVWARDGQSRYHLPSEGRVVKARLDATAGFRVVARDTAVRVWYDVPILRGHATYNVMSDGRLVLMRPVEPTQRLIVTVGWLGALRAECAKPARPSARRRARNRAGIYP